MIESSRYSRKSRRPAQGVLSALCASALFLLICSPVAEAQSLDHSTDELRKLNQSVDALIKKVSPSVVQILVTGYGPLEEGERGSTNAVIGRQRAIGSGFIIDSSGYIMTNAHVVNGAQRVQVVLPARDADDARRKDIGSGRKCGLHRVIGVSRE